MTLSNLLRSNSSHTISMGCNSKTAADMHILTLNTNRNSHMKMTLSDVLRSNCIVMACHSSNIQIGSQEMTFKVNLSGGAGFALSECLSSSLFLWLSRNMVVLFSALVKNFEKYYRLFWWYNLLLLAIWLSIPWAYPSTPTQCAPKLQASDKCTLLTGCPIGQVQLIHHVHTYLLINHAITCCNDIFITFNGHFKRTWKTCFKTIIFEQNGGRCNRWKWQNTLLSTGGAAIDIISRRFCPCVMHMPQEHHRERSGKEECAQQWWMAPNHYIWLFKLLIWDTI
jgi:hypothetical protein